MQAYEQLHRPLPTEIAEWTTLPGLTEAAVQHLYFHLGITTLDDLQTLVRSHFFEHCRASSSWKTICWRPFMRGSPSRVIQIRRRLSGRPQILEYLPGLE